MKYELVYVWSLLNSVLLVVLDRLPHGRVRRALSATFAAIVIIVVIVAGVAIIYIIVFFPSGGTTSTIYP